MKKIFFIFSIVSLSFSLSLISLKTICYKLNSFNNIYSYDYNQAIITVPFLSLDKKTIYYITFSANDKIVSNNIRKNIKAKVNLIINNNHTSYIENLYVDNKTLPISKKGKICFKSGLIYNLKFVKKKDYEIQNTKIFKAY